MTTIYDGTKIERIKLNNFIGIYTGLGLEEIEIDFSVSHYRNVILLGGNGSGKSTIMSTLHPFRETFDERTNLILDGKVGRKEVDITQDGNLYEIIHEYDSSKNKSTIRKTVKGEDPVELNPAGTLRSFNMIVEEELGLQPSFFSLIKIGSASENFIDLKASQRKQFIGNFTPNIEGYLESYKVINTKYSLSNKEIKFVTSELDKLKDPSVINKSIKVLKTSEKSLQNHISELAGRQKHYQSLLNDTTVLTEIDEIEKKLSTIITEKEKISNELNEYREKYDTAFKDKETVKQSLLKKENTQTKRITEYNELNVKRGELGQQTKSNELQIKKIESDINDIINPNDDSVDNLKENLVEQSSIFTEQLSKLSRYNDSDITLATYEPNDDYVDELETLNTSANFLNFTVSQILNERNIEILNEYKKENDAPTVNGMIKFLDNNIEKYNKEYKEIQLALEEMGQLHSDAKQDYEISKLVEDYIPLCSKQEDCCLYNRLNSDSSNQGSMVKHINETDLKLTKLNEELNFYSHSIAETESMQILVPFVQKKVSALSNDEKEYLLSILNEKIGGTYSLLEVAILFSPTNVLESLIGIVNKDVKELKAISRLDTIYRNIERINSQIASYSESTHTVTLLEKNKKALQKENLPIIKEYNEVNDKVSQLKEKINLSTLAIELLHVVVNLLDKENNLETTIISIKKELNRLLKGSKEILDARNSLPEILKELAIKTEELDDIQEELSNERLLLVRYKEYISRKETLESERKLLAILKDALDVKSGIPLILVGEYLDNIRNTCNRLLSIAYKGRFYIDFEISEKDFAISVFKNGIKTADDINACSQGEISLVKTSLSLGIIAQAISTLKKQFNVVYLDEIDAELDYKNRLMFLDILEEQLNTLNAAQCFIITHNDAFFSSSAGLILLNDHKVDTTNEEFMENKTVIYQV